MKNRIVRKSIIIGIFILLIGTVVVPSFSKEIKSDGKGSQIIEPKQTFSYTAPQEEWNKTFGGIKDDAAYDVQQTNDGGFIIGGYTKSFGISMWNPWVIKTNSNGNEQWNKTYDYYSLSSLSGYVQSVQQTGDGGYILGCTFYNATFLDPKDSPFFDYTHLGSVSTMTMVLIKTDSSGNEQWNKTYVGIEYSWCYCIRRTTDGGFIITGGGNRTSSDLSNVFVLKTYPNGTAQWLKSFGTSDMEEEGRWVQQTSDGGFIVSGMSDCNYDTAWGKMWLIKTDAAGSMVWNKKYEGTTRHSFIGPETYSNSVQQTTDNGFIIAGLMDTQGCLLKTTSDGTEVWRKTPFLDDFSFFCYSGKQTSDGGYIATGNGLIKTDATGNERWNVTIPTPFTSGQQTADGGYVIAGSTSGYYNGDAWLIKFQPEAPTPNLTFDVTGGLGVHLKITNSGTVDASGVAWQIHVEGGILGRINVTKNGVVDIAASQSKSVGTSMLFGLGALQITANVDEITKTAQGTQFFMLSMVKK